MTSESGTGGNRLRMLRASPFAVGARLAPGRTALTLGTLLVAATAPAATAVVTGMIVDAATAGGGGAPPGDAAGQVIVWIVVALVTVFLVGQTAAVLVATVSDAYGGLLQRTVEAQAIRASTDGSRAPSPALHGFVDSMRNTAPARQLVTAAANHWLARLQAVFSGCLLVFYQPITGAAVLVAFTFCALLLESEYDQEQSKAYSEASGSRRPRYLSGLAFDPVAAREIKVFRAADWIVGQYDSAVRTAHGDVRIRVRAIMLLAYTAVFASAVVLLAAIAWGSVQGSLSTGEVAVCLAALMGMNGIFAVTMNVVYSRQASALFARATDAGLARRRWSAEAPQEDGAPSGDDARREGGPFPGPRPGSVIRFDRVSYAYPDGTPVFRDLTFEVRLQRNIAIVGVNGAGKTTLVRLLTGTIAPDSGSITCDGEPIGVEERDRARWRAAFAFLGQRFIRYPATLDENIRLAAGERAPREPLRQQAGELVDDLSPRLTGPAAPVLAKGVRDGVDLSGGQWQRVATARAVHALGSDVCRVLVLDEPTAALDAQAEARFFEETGRLTGERNMMIMVSHRLSGVRKADEILVLDRGRIRERGDQEALMRHQGIYAEMFDAQARRYHA